MHNPVMPACLWLRDIASAIMHPYLTANSAVLALNMMLLELLTLNPWLALQCKQFLLTQSMHTQAGVAQAGA